MELYQSRESRKTQEGYRLIAAPITCNCFSNNQTYTNIVQNFILVLNPQVWVTRFQVAS
uniref:Uncharacterized protein n=1 Tax=Arundo donax TaxID=35708 RepID=A0A0A8YZV4_ARUDO